ncbi:ribonuclease P protein component 1 [Methanomethylovorans sp.]|uniref:ribonuclease P protein component 1 n=1 Tax=Methanomethylovorans sp. TaxID=2758717 RepID=UPI00345F0154
MEISAYNLIFHELIGLFTEVINSNNPSLKKIRGKVVGETRNMLIVETYDNNEKMVPKSGSTFLFHIPLLGGNSRVTEQVKVNGNLLLSQPENRIKNIRKIRMR